MGPSLSYEGVTVMGATMARRRPESKKAQEKMLGVRSEANKKYESSKAQEQVKKPVKKSKG